MQRNKMQLRGNNKVLLPEEGWLLSTVIQSTILEYSNSGIIQHKNDDF